MDEPLEIRYDAELLARGLRMSRDQVTDNRLYAIHAILQSMFSEYTVECHNGDYFIGVNGRPITHGTLYEVGIFMNGYSLRAEHEHCAKPKHIIKIEETIQRMKGYLDTQLLKLPKYK